MYGTPAPELTPSQREEQDARLEAIFSSAIAAARKHAMGVFVRRLVPRLEDRIGIFCTSLRSELNGRCTTPNGESSVAGALRKEFDDHRNFLCETRNWTDVGVLGYPSWRWNSDKRKWGRFYHELDYTTMDRNKLKTIVDETFAPYDPQASLEEMRKLIESTKALNLTTASLNVRADQVLTNLCVVAEALEQPVILA